MAYLAKAVTLNPTYAKAFYRRGLSYLAILRPTDAVSDFKKGLALEPGNAAIRSQLAMTVKLVRRIEFEKVRRPSQSTTKSPC
jgi:serine/threonine-protein phosphatase 5